MMVSATLLLLLGALAGSILADTKFVFTGAVTCKRSQTFNYRILVYEDDICYDNLISGVYSPSQLQVSSPHFYNITATDSDDGPFDSHFEIVFMIVHDCTGWGAGSLKARFEIGSYEITHGTHYITRNFDLTNVGTPWDKIIKRSTSATCPIGCNCEADE